MARRSIDWEVLLAIAASLRLGDALEKTGAAGSHCRRHDRSGAGQSLGLAGGDLRGHAAVDRADHQQRGGGADVSVGAGHGAATWTSTIMPFVIAVMMAASAGFATPIGYQTNLMVYGPGGYRFSDYVKIGVPLDILIGVITVGLSPLIWPF